MILVALLRLLHIVAAFSWFGLGSIMTLYVAPAAAASGESGLRFHKTLFTQTPIARSFAVTGGLTTLCGILLYLFGASTHFTTLGNIVLGIGAVAGLLAVGHGGMATTRATTAYVADLNKYVVDNQPISAEGTAALRESALKTANLSRISFILMAVALIGMASARYL